MRADGRTDRRADGQMDISAAQYVRFPKGRIKRKQMEEVYNAQV